MGGFYGGLPFPPVLPLAALIPADQRRPEFFGGDEARSVTPCRIKPRYVAAAVEVDSAVEH